MGERPEDMTVAIANAKADALLPRLDGRNVLLICMDQVREKPENDTQAREFLESYRRGKGATCVNGIVVHNTSTGKRVSAVQKASLFWRHFPDSVIDHLLTKAEIFTCAGGFTVEDPELSTYVERMDDAPNGVRAARAAGMQVCHGPDS